MEHLDNSPPITLMALGEMYNIEEATKRVTTYANADETRSTCVSSPLGSRARAKIMDIQDNLIIQGMPSAKRIPGRLLTLRYMKAVVSSEQQEMLTTVLRHAIKDPSEYGLSFLLGEISTDSLVFLVISIRGNNLRSLENRLKECCKSLNTAHSIEHLGNIMLFTPKKGDNLHYHQLEQELHWDKTPDVFLINEVNAFSSYSSRPGCTTINLLSPKDAMYQAKAKQTDALMHPWKEDNAQLYNLIGTSRRLQEHHHGRSDEILC